MTVERYLYVFVFIVYSVILLILYVYLFYHCSYHSSYELSLSVCFNASLSYHCHVAYLFIYVLKVGD